MTAIDLKGRTFGRLTAVSRVNNDRNGKAVWVCRCECGAEAAIRARGLISGRTRSCGCLRGVARSGARGPSRRGHDLTGQRFGRLQVLGRQGSGPTGAVWRCRCDCGRERLAPTTLLSRGKQPVRSCGCLAADVIRSRGQAKARRVELWGAPVTTKELAVICGVHVETIRRELFSLGMTAEQVVMSRRNKNAGRKQGDAA